MDEYNELRESLGMTPASQDDLGEVVAFLVVFELLAPTVDDECGRLPAAERDIFMMTYAAYLKYLVVEAVQAKFPEGSLGVISPVLEREFARQPWYQPQIMQQIYDSMVELPPSESKGRYSGMRSPWTGAEFATNTAGFKLTYTTSYRFLVYVIAVSTKLFEALTKMTPTGP